MGFDLDMTRGYGWNRGHIGKTLAKRRKLKALYIKGLESKNYSYYNDTVPRLVSDEINSEIRKTYALERRRSFIKAAVVLAVILVLFTFIMYTYKGSVHTWFRVKY